MLGLISLKSIHRHDARTGSNMNSTPMCTLHILKKTINVWILACMHTFFLSIPAVFCCCWLRSFLVLRSVSYWSPIVWGLVRFSSIWTFTFKCNTSHKHIQHSLTDSLTISIIMNKNHYWPFTACSGNKSRNNHIDTVCTYVYGRARAWTSPHFLYIASNNIMIISLNKVCDVCVSLTKS